MRIEAEPVPLTSESDGAIRVKGSRVTLDTIVGAFCRGATAEEIVQQYSSLHLADVYAVIAYYLHHQPEIEAYLQEGQIEALRIRALNEAHSPPVGIRERLLARRKSSADGSNAYLGRG